MVATGIINVDRAVIVSNFQTAKKYLEARGVKASVMQKTFYSPLCIDEALEGEYYQLWGSHNGSFNYVLGQSLFLSPDYAGGIVTTLDEARAIQYKYTSLKKKFKGYIPLNWNDDREGLSYEDTLDLLKECSELGNDYFDCMNVMITSGCLHNRVPSFGVFRDLCAALEYEGCKNVSLGGSYWLQFSEFPSIVEECRLGEFIIYGTIPFCTKNNVISGKSSVEVELTVAQVYKDRGQALLSGGSVYFDAKNSQILSDTFIYESQSTEYTIVSYRGDQDVKVGEKVKFLPDYHSLIKLLR